MDNSPHYYRAEQHQKTPEIIEDMQISQTFLFDKPNMNRIDLTIGAWSNTHTEDVILHLREVSMPDVDKRTIVKNAQGLGRNIDYSFDFEPINDSENKEYFFIFESPNSSRGNAIALWYNENGDEYTEGELFVNKIVGIDCNLERNVNEKTVLSLEVKSGGSKLECQLIHTFSTPQDWSMYKILNIKLKSSKTDGNHEVFLFTENGINRYEFPIISSDWRNYSIDLTNPTDFSRLKDLDRVKSIRVDPNYGTQLVLRKNTQHKLSAQPPLPKILFRPLFRGRGLGKGTFPIC